ncbi:hypothetical protein SAVIM338S_06290 [Streptomyces avidinii]
MFLAVSCTALSGGAVASGDSGEEVFRGVSYREFMVSTGHGGIRVHVVRVDLKEPGVRAGLLYAGSVTDRLPVSQLAQEQGAVAAVNGDFFHIVETQHPGVAATGSVSGPVVLGGRALKGAVPEGQRFGWKPPAGDSAADVMGVGVDGRARPARLTLSGEITSPGKWLRLHGLNQYALPVDGIGLFTSEWGSASRARAVCGTDTSRSAPCTTDAYEVSVRAGRVISVSATPGTGPIEEGTQVLLGREAGAGALREFTIGEPVSVRYRLSSTAQVPFDFALGAHRILTQGRESAGLDNKTAEPRTAIGTADGGTALFLVATDGREGAGSGLTVSELARTLQDLACEEGLYMDGGASTTLVTRDPATGRSRIRNHLDQGQERRVPNGIAVFSN